VTVNENLVRRRLTDLAEDLTRKGQLRSPEWRETFLAVRRHVFVPRYWHDEAPGTFPARWRMIDNATADHDTWLDTVYSNRTLATELTGVPSRTGPGMHPQVTSSTTMPGLVMAMLEDLDLADGMQVLEIGTGTGYNAALLCQRLGSEHVTSIDISHELVALARVRLADHGYHPHLVVGDGVVGVPEHAPFDRIIATCGLHNVPAAWIDQTRDGGRILLNLLGPFNGYAMVLLTVTDQRASGRFLHQSGSFMPRRTDPTRAADYTVPITRPDTTNITTSHTTHAPGTLYTDTTWGLLAQTALPGILSRQICLDPAADDDRNDRLATELATPDETSWAGVHHDGIPSASGEENHHVEQAGPRRLWDELEHLHQQWTALGSPPAQRLGITIDTGGTLAVWLDHPDGHHLWTAPDHAPSGR
jgi:methyltransferase of ATP-grasp peptide maturase system